MERREFLASSLAASALAASTPEGLLQGAQKASDMKSREFYMLRHYILPRGPQVKMADDYFRDALVPALNRLGISQVGVFNVAVGPDTPAVYVLLPSTSAETLLTAENPLVHDAEYLKAAAPFWNADARQPAFEEMNVSVMQAFENMPKLAVPAATAQHQPRLYELRTYRSRGQQDHNRKVEMFNSAEIDIQKQVGLAPIFYSDTIAGPNMPNLIYMVSFSDYADRDKKWAAFQASSDWKSLNSQPKYPTELVSNITNILVTPAAYSQI